MARIHQEHRQRNRRQGRASADHAHHQEFHRTGKNQGREQRRSPDRQAVRIEDNTQTQTQHSDTEHHHGRIRNSQTEIILRAGSLKSSALKLSALTFSAM